jgi:hypothetical protein
VITEREALLLGDYVVAEARKERRPSWLWHFGFEGQSVRYARKTLSAFGFYLTTNDVLRLIGRA